MAAYTAATDYAVPTGDYVTEWLEENDVSQAELARRMGVSGKHVSKLISGAALTPDVATKLALVTGIPSRIWLGWEATYRADVARLSLSEQLAAHRSVVELFPLAHLRKLGVVTASLRKPGVVALELFAFFGVASIGALERCVTRQAVAYRQGLAHPVDEHALATWLRIGELEANAEAGELSAYDENGLRELLPQLRALSANPQPNFGQELVARLARVGVQLIYVPEVKGARVYGATRWLQGRPVIALTLRGRTDGQFWFTLFHEIGHVLLHKDAEAHVHSVDAQGPVNPAEVEANHFAGTTLIPTEYERFLATLRSKQDVRKFAAAIGVSPGIVVGRLWHDRIWDFKNGQDLCMRLHFSEDD
ncbi:MAG: ImmA/IrrE family metallo-endopeptidase [Spirosoma sp.]|nr:ImmA/IrrE family metallo-endopeptidase [Spirosoma sp.]